MAGEAYAYRMTKVTVIPEVVDLSKIEFGWKTVLMNCNCHSFEEVIDLIMRAIGCSTTRASQLASAVHHLGEATICEGEKRYCSHVADILGSTGLKVVVTQ